MTTTPTQSPLSLPLELIEACDENNAIIGPTENTGIPWSLHIVCADDAEANRVGNALVETLNAIDQARTKAGEPVDFWKWIKTAYRGSANPEATFTVWNMEVAFQAGRSAISPPPADQAAPVPGVDREAVDESFELIEGDDYNSNLAQPLPVAGRAS